MDEAMCLSFIHFTQQMAMNNHDPLLVTNTKSGSKELSTG